MHLQQTTIARLINITNQATPPGTKDWRRTLTVRVFYDRLELHTTYSIVALPAREWRLELDPAIPNRAIIRHIPTSTQHHIHINPWLTIATLRNLYPKQRPLRLPSPPPTTEFTLITRQIFQS